jgi:phage gp29-like protein
MVLKTQRPSQREQKKQDLLDEVRDRPKNKRLNVEIDPDLFRRIKAHAAMQGRTITDITKELWLEYLSKNANEHP